MASKIPDRWLKYKAIGERVAGTRFIAFKVPLKENINKHVEENARFDGHMLLDKVPNLGVIIDLTNTNRYYDPCFFKDVGVDHIKLKIPGHVTPAQTLVKCFKDFVKSFLQKNRENDKLIGVHCTHGVNRTGFLICNYMVSEMAMDPKEAIEKFACARGHNIERDNYLNALNQLTASVGENTRIMSTNATIPLPQMERTASGRFDARRIEGSRKRRADNGSPPRQRNIQSWQRPPNNFYEPRPGGDQRSYESWRQDNTACGDRHTVNPWKRSRTEYEVRGGGRGGRLEGVTDQGRVGGPIPPERSRFDNRYSRFLHNRNRYNQQCSRESYDFQQMEFRGRSSNSSNSTNDHTIGSMNSQRMHPYRTSDSSQQMRHTGYSNTRRSSSSLSPTRRHSSGTPYHKRR